MIIRAASTVPPLVDLRDGRLTDMNTQSEQILQSALALPELERAEIAASLIQSLDSETDDDADAAWAAEIQRRIEEIDNGDVKLIPWDDVMREMRRT